MGATSDDSTGCAQSLLPRRPLGQTPVPNLGDFAEIQLACLLLSPQEFFLSLFSIHTLLGTSVAQVEAFSEVTLIMTTPDTPTPKLRLKVKSAVSLLKRSGT